jgi:glycerate-2-kinase
VSSAPLRADALACHAAALAAVEPARLVAGCLSGDGRILVLRDPQGRPLARHEGPVLLVGAGKASIGLVDAATEAAGTALVGGLVIVPHGSGRPSAGAVEVATAGHPVPDTAGEATTRRILDMVSTVADDVLTIVLLSGGGSALLVAPAPGLTLEDKRALTEALLTSGADIAALNTVRKHCSRVKGGGLARAARGARLWALLLSDVVGDDPALVASGPTVADPSTFRDAAWVLAAHLPPERVPPAVRAHVARGVAGEVPETVKAGDPVLDRVRTLVLAGNRDAVTGAARAAAARGYAVEVLGTPLTGDATEAGRTLAGRLRAAPGDRPVAIIAGGETTVRVRPGGRGGRSQQLALAAAIALAGEPGVILAAGTDGIDGPTAAAGACVDGDSIARAHASGFDPQRALDATDSNPLLLATGDLLVTGPTGTNVADVVVALRGAY